jgi:hypothetical protein
MAEVTEGFVNNLKAVRGEFQNTKVGRIGNRILAHVFSTIFPLLFIGILIFGKRLEWPPNSENWLFIVFTILAFAMGLVFHRSINSRYLFDDDGVREYRGNGKLKETILWNDLVKVEFRESRNIKTFTLKTQSNAIQLEYYKSLGEALARIEKGSR